MPPPHAAAPPRPRPCRVAGSASCAARLERRSLSRRLLLISVIFPAQITALVLVTGWLLGTFRPVPLLAAALAAGVGRWWRTCGAG